MCIPGSAGALEKATPSGSFLGDIFCVGVILHQGQCGQEHGAFARAHKFDEGVKVAILYSPDKKSGFRRVDLAAHGRNTSDFLTIVTVCIIHAAMIAGFST